ncbi:acetyltransferase [Vibrio cholerae]|nr:acetyltransferase [Vibrio cholerae]
MVTVVVIEFGVMRCQPLRRALAVTVQWRHNVSHS